jgi:hypothetical protein
LSLPTSCIKDVPKGGWVRRKTFTAEPLNASCPSFQAYRRRHLRRYRTLPIKHIKNALDKGLEASRLRRDLSAATSGLILPRETTHPIKQEPGRTKISESRWKRWIAVAERGYSSRLNFSSIFFGFPSVFFSDFPLDKIFQAYYELV